MTDIAALITAVSAGVSIFGACLWWVVSTSFNLRANIAKVETSVMAVRAVMETEIISIRAEITSLQQMSHGRELWLKEVSATVQRIDKNVVKLAAMGGVDIIE